MNYKTKMLISAIGMVLVMSYAAMNIVSGDADEVKRSLPPALSNLANVNTIEIKDGEGQTVLSGSFGAATDEPDEIERTAMLTRTSVDGDATGHAEIEISKERVPEHKLEVTVKRLAAGAAYKIVIDGQEIASFTVSAAGEAELEFSNQPSK